MNRRSTSKRRFNPHEFLLQAKLWTIEVLGTIVFIVWIVRAFLHEIGLR